MEKNRKGFTLIELIAVIVILGIISMIAVAGYSSYLEHAQEEYYKDAESTMKGSTEGLIIYCASSILGEDYCVDIPQPNNSVTVSLSTLTEHNFMSKVYDQKTEEECSGQVTVYSKEQNSQNYQFEYKVCLRCSSYKSSDCE